MKKILPPLCLLFLVCTAKAQFVGNQPWGVWGLGYIKGPNALDMYNGYAIEGFHLYISWDSLEPQRDQFAWDKLDAVLRVIQERDIWIGMQILVGQNSPAWIYNTVPMVHTTGGNDDGPYPYYLDPNYKKRYFNVLKQLIDHISNLPSDLKSKVMYLQISEGSTGDEDPYKGDPTDPQYDIDYYTWQDFRHEAWDSANAYKHGQWWRFLYNTGNYAQDIQYVDAKYPRDLQKTGLLSHWYAFDGEVLYYLRQYRDLLRLPFSMRTRGEVQDNFNKSWWKLAPVKQAFTLYCSALSGGMDMANIGGGYIDATEDRRPTDFYRNYAGFRNAADANRGFIGLRDVPDFGDLSRFSVEEYGPLIAPGSEQAFLNKIAKIESNPKDSSMRKYWLKMKAVTQFLNPARVTRITQEFAPAGAMYNTTDDDYHNDFGTNMTDNYSKFIRQVDPNNTSIGAWRIGPDTSMYGRYARMFKISNRGQGEMWFAFNDLLAESGESVIATVTYYDTGNGQWSINGANRHLTVTNKNTRQWVQKIVPLEEFIPKTLLDGEADMSLRYEGGTNTPFALIEIEVRTRRDGVKATAENLSVKLSPNPNKGQFNVELNSKTNESYKVFVTNTSGNMIFSEKKTAIAGANVWSFSSPKLKEGVYVLHVESATTKGSVSFVVNK